MADMVEPQEGTRGMNRHSAWITGSCMAALACANVWLLASPADSARRPRAVDVIDGSVLTPTLRSFGPVTGDALGPAPAPTAYAFVPALAVDVLEAAPLTTSNDVPHFARRRAMDWEVPPTNFALVRVQGTREQTPGWIGDLLNGSNVGTGQTGGSYERGNGGGASGTGGGAAQHGGGGGGGGIGVAGRAMRAAADGVSPAMGKSVLEAGNAGGGDVPATAAPPTKEAARDPNESASSAPGVSPPGSTGPTVHATSGSGSGSSGSGNNGSRDGRSWAALPATTPQVSNGAPIVPAPAVPGLGTSQPDTTGPWSPGDGLTPADTIGGDGGGALPPLPIDAAPPAFPPAGPGDSDGDTTVPMDPHTAAVSTLEGMPPDPAVPPGSQPSRVGDGSLALLTPGAVPEPALITLLALAVLGVAHRRFRAPRP